MYHSNIGNINTIGILLTEHILDHLAYKLKYHYICILTYVLYIKFKQIKWSLTHQFFCRTGYTCYISYSITKLSSHISLLQINYVIIIN